MGANHSTFLITVSATLKSLPYDVREALPYATLHRRKRGGFGLSHTDNGWRLVIPVWIAHRGGWDICLDRFVTGWWTFAIGLGGSRILSCGWVSPTPKARFDLRRARLDYAPALIADGWEMVSETPKGDAS